MMRTSVLGIGAFLSMVVVAPHFAEACSRAVYFGEAAQTVTGRTMDWFVSDMDTNMWQYPRELVAPWRSRPSLYFRRLDFIIELSYLEEP